MKNTRGFLSVFNARSLAVYLEGSQYITCESSNDVCTRIAGYAFAVTLSYGEYVSM